jgi:hypothetical protein
MLTPLENASAAAIHSDEAVDGEVLRENTAGKDGRPPRRGRGRASVPMLIAAFILALTMGSYLTRGFLLLLNLGVLEGKIPPITLGEGLLTPLGERLVLAGFYLFFGLVALLILVGFFLRRRWAWTAAMTWTAASLALNLVAYFRGKPNYLTMVEAVVMMLVLNQAAVHRVFSTAKKRASDV